MQEQLLYFVREIERVQVLQAHGGGDHGVVGAEHDLFLAVLLHVADQLGRKAFGGIGRGIDVDILVLGGDGDHLGRPGVAYMASHDL